MKNEFTKSLFETIIETDKGTWNDKNSFAYQLNNVSSCHNESKTLNEIIDK